MDLTEDLSTWPDLCILFPTYHLILSIALGGKPCRPHFGDVDIETCQVMWGATVQRQAAGTFPEPDTIPDTVFAVHHLISEHLFEGQICIVAILKMSKLHLGCFGHLLGLPGPSPTCPGACILNDMPPCPKFRNTRVGSGVLPPRKREISILFFNRY